MAEQLPKNGPDAHSDAPTELDLSQESVQPDRGAAEPEIQPVELKLATLEFGDTEVGAPKPQRTAETYVGFIIDGRFHVESIVASGGMGVVYKARHRVIDKPVALKILRPELVHDRDITERFLTEAQAASASGNEHIVDITDYGELPDGATYLVMEFLEGESLGTRLKRDNDPLLVSEVGDIARQLAEGLHSAHEAQIIHRDLKPDNVFLITRGKEPNFVKILDFGIAKVQSGQNHETRAGHIFGTPHYMSPEQARGEPLDRRSDIYAFGVMLYQMLAGRLPFDGENPLGILTQHMYVEPTPLCDVCDDTVPAGLEAIVLKCMSKSPDERYDTLEAVEGELLRLRGGQLPLAVLDLVDRKTTPQSLRKKLRKAARKRSPLVVPLLLSVAATAAAVGLVKAQPVPFTWLRAWTEASQTATSAPPPAPSVLGDRLKTVALVLSPIDAHVFHGQRDLGMMPLNVRLRDGQRRQLEVRREGYRSQKISVDGSNERIQVELRAIPGSSPPPPAERPQRNQKEARVISLQDSGVQATEDSPAGASHVRADAGLPQRPSPTPLPRERAGTVSSPPAAIGEQLNTGGSPATVPVAAATPQEPAPSNRPPGPPPQEAPEGSEKSGDIQALPEAAEN